MKVYYSNRAYSTGQRIEEEQFEIASEEEAEDFFKGWIRYLQRNKHKQTTGTLNDYSDGSVCALGAAVKRSVANNLTDNHQEKGIISEYKALGHNPKEQLNLETYSYTQLPWIKDGKGNFISLSRAKYQVPLHILERVYDKDAKDYINYYYEIPELNDDLELSFDDIVEVIKYNRCKVIPNLIETYGVR